MGCGSDKSPTRSGILGRVRFGRQKAASNKSAAVGQSKGTGRSTHEGIPENCAVGSVFGHSVGLETRNQDAAVRQQINSDSRDQRPLDAKTRLLLAVRRQP